MRCLLASNLPKLCIPSDILSLSLSLPLSLPFSLYLWASLSLSVSLSALYFHQLTTTNNKQTKNISGAMSKLFASMTKLLPEDSSPFSPPLTPPSGLATRLKVAWRALSSLLLLFHLVAVAACCCHLLRSRCEQCQTQTCRSFACEEWEAGLGGRCVVGIKWQVVVVGGGAGGGNRQQ